MINGYKVLALITARGGSIGVIRKNVREIAGKPLIAWTIEAAKRSVYIDRLVLSTENEEIANVARQWGCEVPFVRPSELAQADTPGIEPVLHAIKLISGYDYVVLLQPTSPLRTSEDIDNCIELCERKESNASVSVTVPDKSPYWMFSLDEHKQMFPIVPIENNGLRRQDLPPAVALNGAVYVAKCNWLLKEKSFLSKETLAYEMDKERSIDIDTEYDLHIADTLLRIINKEQI